MSVEAQMMMMLSIIGVLITGLVILYIGSVDSKFNALQGWMTKISDKFDKHLEDCSNKRGN